MINDYMTKESQKKAKLERTVAIQKYIQKNTIPSNYLKLVPDSQQWLFYQVYTGENSRSKAIKAKCLDCSTFNKEEIKHCEVFTCPLFNFRPYQGK